MSDGTRESAAWKVDFTTPDPNHRWVRNMNVTVITDTLERAAELVRQQYADCTLVAIHKVSAHRQVIVDESP